jgi:hypothetical protein
MVRTRALVGLVALAIFAPAAKANLYCVNTASCPGGTAETDFQQALNDAQVHGGSDNVQLGPGTFDSPFGFSYSGSDPVDIVGAGSGSTTISDSGVASGTDLLRIAGSTGSTVSELRLVNEGTYLGGSPFPSALNTVGSANNIAISAPPSSTNVNGIAAGPASVISHVSIDIPLHGSSGFNEAVVTSPGTVVEDSAIQGDQAVDVFGSGAAVTLRRMTIRSDLQPVFADTGSTVSLQDSLILSVGTDPVGLEASHDPPNITADGVTMVGPGTPGSIALDARSGGSIAFRNSIAIGYGSTFDTDSTSSISTDYSDYTGTRSGTGTITEGHQLNVDPGFVNAAAGDYRLAAGSPLIDAGDPAGPAAGDSLTDLAGNARVAGGRLDIGA